MKTFCPGFSWAVSTSACHAVSATRGSEAHGEVVGLECHGCGADGDELGERPDAIIVGARIYLVARFELENPGANTFHRAGQVVAQNQRQAIRQDHLELAPPDLRVQRVDAGRMHADEHIVIAQRRRRHVIDMARLLLAVPVDEEGFHGR